MLTDAAIKALRPKEKLYKIVDRDGMYVVVQPSGAIVFRLDYRLNGRRETLTLGRYGPAGLSLARAREKVVDARRAISEGRSPAQEKQREKRRIKEAKSFGQFGERWLWSAPQEVIHPLCWSEDHLDGTRDGKEASQAGRDRREAAAS